MCIQEEIQHHKGFSFKLNNIKDLPEIIKNAKYVYSNDEIGKQTRQHKDVQEWHYFTNTIQVGEELFNVIVNIRDKGDKQYVYEVTFQ